MNAGTLATAAVVTVPSCYLINRWAQGGQFLKDDVRIDGKVVIITGANTGIGAQTALDLARRGAKVYLACRDLAKADPTRMKIVHKTGNKKIFSVKLDLSSFESIRKFVDEWVYYYIDLFVCVCARARMCVHWLEWLTQFALFSQSCRFKKMETQLHILINNAGVMAIDRRQTTSDNLEMQIGTNHFGHFLLTSLLLDMLKASAPARIINVSSLGHKGGKLNRDDLQAEKSYSKWQAYMQSKLANVLFTRELAKRLKGTGVTVNSLHPGAVTTELGRHLTVLSYVVSMFRIFYKTPKSGAQTTIMLAVDPDVAEVTGRYFADCAIAKESQAAQNDEDAAWLWAISEKITSK